MDINITYIQDPDAKGLRDIANIYIINTLAIQEVDCL